MRNILRRLMGKKSVPEIDPDDDFSWMLPPSTTTDPGAWDKFWQDQLDNDVAQFVDMFCNDENLVHAMRANGFQTVLCVGSGLSQEPRALAWAGFDVTALDISPMAMAFCEQATFPPEYLATLVGVGSAAEGGSVRFVAGDLRDATLCPGPYDVVIERRTLQIYPESEFEEAMAAVTARLSNPGVLLSHCHDGAWKPPKPPTNVTEVWFETQGRKIWRGEGPLSGQAVWTLTTTG